MRELHEAHNALLRIWPAGRDCCHVEAAKAFRLIESAIEKYEIAMRDIINLENLNAGMQARLDISMKGRG